MMNNVWHRIATVVVATLLAGCGASGENPGKEYAPNMYHSVPYEPLTQIMDEEAGAWANALDSGREGEYYNSNPYNPFQMTMRKPPPHTVKRNDSGWLPYRFGKDDLEAASAVQNPLDSTEAVLKEGKLLYASFCLHCHGEKGNGDGKVATGVTVDGVEKGLVAGVANLNGAAYQDITEGHIFHVITWGRNLMQAHGSQMSPEDRWKIAKYVKALQKENQ